MEPKFNTSFIPKRPVVETASVPNSPYTKSTNIFSVAASAVFAITLVAMVGLFAYKIVLSNQITQADKDVNAARAAFDTSKIQDLIDANSRISAIKNLLEKHVVVSEFLTLLQSLTVKRIKLNSLKYDDTNDTPNITMQVEAQSYNSIAAQSDVFSKSDFIKDEQFSNFRLEDNGSIAVDFFANIDPTLVSYKKAVEALPQGQ